MSVIATIEQLEAIYGFPNDASTVKVADRVTPPYRILIEKSPFAALATSGPEGLDCSPRGDLPGFVRIHDDSTLMMPDRRGNNRVDSLRNIVRDPRVALLFLIPGSGTTLRINGRAHLSVDPDLLASFKMEGNAPRSIIVMTVGEIYFQCARAIVRAGLWSPDRRIDPRTLPTPGPKSSPT
jgi:PPOX class probable FMN-dependent enzyme